MRSTAARLRLRQIALVARDLEPVVGDLCHVLGTEVVFRDPNVAVFGLHNALMPLGDTFLEVVSPIRPDASAARLLERRRGDGGYMVIVQTSDLAADRRRLAALGVRIVFETTLDDIATIHLHPRDVGGAIVSLDAAQPPSSWRWAGPDWEARPRGDAAIVGAELQGPDPAALAARWSQVLDRRATEDGAGGHVIRLDDGVISFVAERDRRGEGLAGIAVRVPDPGRALAAARARALPTNGDQVDICGTRIRLLQKSV